MGVGHEKLAEEARKAGADEADEGIFWVRFGAASAAIRKGFAELYGEGPEARLWHERMITLLARAWRSRDEELRERDRRSEAGPWYLRPGLSAAMLYLDRFAGDFAGFARRLGWLSELGVDIVHLMPFMKSPKGENDGGYAVSDYLGVDPRFGSEADLPATARLLHDKGMFLAADLVLNHSSDEHPWALAARSGDPRFRSYYWFFPDRELPDRFEAAMPEVFPETAPGNFTWLPDCQAWVMTVFNRYQWDLNWTNPEVFVEMLTIILEMANRGIDLIRLDAVPYLWKRPGTSCQNLGESHAIVRLLKAAVSVVAPSLAFLAEAIVQPAEIVKYLDAFDEATGVVREECQLAYHASLMALMWESLATRRTGLLKLTFGGETRLAPGTAWFSYARCHDDIGLGYDDDLIRRVGFDPTLHRRFLVDWYTGRFHGSPASGRPFMENPDTGDARISGTCASLSGLERALDSGDQGAIELALRRIELLHALASSLVGIPMIYSGDEIASLNDYSYEKRPELAADNRWMHRPKMDWKAAEAAARGEGHQGRVLAFIRNCLRVRRSIPALAQDAPFEVLPSEEGILAVLRRPSDPSARPLLVLANFTEDERRVEIDRGLLGGAGAGLVDLLGAEGPGHAAAMPGAGPIAMRALGVRWLSRE